MSNGLTDVFLNVLVLSGSALARNDSERRLIVWLAEQDQSRMGYGAIGFDLCEMPWDPKTFEADKIFLLHTIEAAKYQQGWGQLDYCPNEDLLFPCLDRFAALVSRMDLSEIQPAVLGEWLSASDKSDPVMCGFPVCPKHHTFLSVFGCHLCNN